MPDQKTKHWSRTIPFKVDIAGVIHLMGTALYSRPHAAIRELIQNAHDAVMRRRMEDLDYRGLIQIRHDKSEGILEVVDDGVGLTEDDAEQFLGTLGIGMTGLLKGEHPAAQQSPGQKLGLIGQFGIGLFSSFMLADQLTVFSRHKDSEGAIQWKAGPGTDILLSSSDRHEVGTCIRLDIKPQYRDWIFDEERLEQVIKEYADYITIPIHLNDGPARINVAGTQWFEATPDEEGLSDEFEAHFGETPLDVIPIHRTTPITIKGALYISPQRSVGFSDQAVVTATIQRMAVSRRVQDLIPAWASFMRGVLELPECRPTTSREELVRNDSFWQTATMIEEAIFQRLETLAEKDLAKLESIIAWHRFSIASAALDQPRLRKLLFRSYRFQTSQGSLTADEILQLSSANPLFETEFDHVVWFHTDRRQESLINDSFVFCPSPCVHAVRSFEESLLAAMIGDVDDGHTIDLRLASLASPGFARDVLMIRDVTDAPKEWCDFLSISDAEIRCASFDDNRPVIALLNEQHQMKRSFDDIKKEQSIPPAFQRLIDRHFKEEESPRNEILMNRNHRLVKRALEKETTAPLASVLRLLVLQTLTAAGAAPQQEGSRVMAEDLDWIADALWGRSTERQTRS